MTTASKEDYGDFGILTGKVVADIMSDTEVVYHWRGGSVAGFSRDYLGTFFKGINFEPGDRFLIGEIVMEVVDWHNNWMEVKRVIVGSVEER
jgi:hypothetical protein